MVEFAARSSLKFHPRGWLAFFNEGPQAQKINHTIFDIPSQLAVKEARIQIILLNRKLGIISEIRGFKHRLMLDEDSQKISLVDAEPY